MILGIQSAHSDLEIRNHFRINFIVKLFVIKLINDTMLKYNFIVFILVECADIMQNHMQMLLTKKLLGQ